MTFHSSPASFLLLDRRRLIKVALLVPLQPRERRLDVVLHLKLLVVGDLLGMGLLEAVLLAQNLDGLLLL